MCSLLTGFQAWVRSSWAQSHRPSLIPGPCLVFLVSAAPCLRPQYDNRADDLTKDGMLKGIESSAAFVLFLSTGVLERPYCQLEIRHALALKKPIVLLHGEMSESTRAARACALHV